MRERSARHLVVVTVPIEQANGAASLKLRTVLLARLARALLLAEFYAIVELPARSGHEVRCALAREADAMKRVDRWVPRPASNCARPAVQFPIAPFVVA